MPLNEAGRARSNLTRQQKQAALAAIYGLQENMSPSQFTQNDIEKMRAMVNESDKRHATQETLDLNKPPAKSYTHQEYPRIVYRSGAYVRISDEQEHIAALNSGWSNEPLEPAAAPVPELDPASAAEAAAVETQLAKKKRAR